MKKEDFTATVNKGGYMINYKGKPIGGAGTLSNGANLKGKQVMNAIKEYRQQADYTISEILQGRIIPHMKRAINEIDSINQ